MNRTEFMQAFQNALYDVPSEERDAALEYYNDYLDDAGPEKEEQILQEWGSPERLAQSIRGGMNGKLENGEFTEHGFSDGEEKFVPAPADERKQESQSPPPVEKARKKTGVNIWKLVSIVLLCILLGPVCIPIAAAAGAVLVTIVLLIAAVLFVFLAIGLAILCSGVAIAVAGVAKLFVFPAGALVLFGCGLLITVVGGLITWLFGWLVVKSSAWLFRAVVDLCRRPFHGKRRGGAGQ